MPKIAVFGGTGYLASLIKNQNGIKKNRFIFFSRKKKEKNYINIKSYNKNLNTLKNFDFIIHFAGPNQSQLKKNKKLIRQKNLMTSKICDLCLINNIKLIYISSMQVYKYYGKKDISINSEINLDNLYSKSHLESEKIIAEKFLKQRNMFTILRMGNVFGFRKNNKTRGIYSNLIHSFCSIGLKKGKIFIKNGSIQRTYIPSQIFVNMINLIINKDLFYNTIENVSYKNFTLKEVSYIIQKRFKLLFKHNIIVKIEKFNYGKKFNIKNKYIKFNIDYKKIYFEIDQLFKILKKKVKT